MTDFEGLLRSLNEGGVEYVLIGGLAGQLHGVDHLTQDVDIIYNRTDANLARLVTALSPLRPYLRGAPEGLPFLWDAQTLRMGLNFTLTTTKGYIDLLGEAAGAGGYDNLVHDALTVEVFGLKVQIASLSSLVKMKRAAGRPKDLEFLAKLEATKEEQEELSKEQP